MIRRTFALLTLLILVLPAASVWPLGVGNIELGSALNEPLSARIPLRSLEAGDIDGMRVALGTPEQFQRAGVERPFLLTQLKFDVVPTSNGAYISVSSREAVAEPFLNFLLEVNWPRGRVIREYTVLLDPPVYGAAIASTVRQSVPTVAEEPSATSTSTSTSASTSSSASTTPAATPTSGTRVATIGEYGPVTETDTLWSLSERYGPDGAYSVHQTMLAILNANPEAFSHANVNTLRAGSILRIPTADEIAGVGRAAALEEVKRQHDEWQDIRAAIGLAPPRAAPQGTTAPAPVASETAVETVQPSAAPATGQTDSRLELVGAGSDAQGTVGAPEQATSVDELRREMNLALEEVEAGRRQSAELGERLTDAEALIDDLRRLVELKDESIAALQQQLAAAELPVASALPDPGPAPIATQPEPAPMPVPEPTAPASVPEPAAPAPAPQPAAPAPVPDKPKVPLPPPPPPAPTSFMEILADVLPVDPLLLAGGLGGLVLLGGLAAVVVRRRRNAEEESYAEPEEDATEIGAIIDQYAHTAPPDDDDATDVKPAFGSDTVVEELPVEQQTVVGGDTQPSAPRPTREEEDPLAEVNNYLAYEHFDQAEELVRRAVEQYPDRHDYRVRLLDVLRQSRKVGAFAVEAAALRELVGDDTPMMEKATTWWSELAPDSEPFEVDEATAAANAEFTQTHIGLKDDDIFDVTETGDVGASAVDFDLGFEMTGSDGDTTEIGSHADHKASTVDFDLGGEGTGSELDFVLDGDDTEQGTNASPEVDFALGLDDDDASLDAEASAKGPDADVGIDTVTNVESEYEKVAAANELDLDLGDSAQPDADDESDYTTQIVGAEGTTNLAPSTDDGADREDAGDASDADIDFDLGTGAELELGETDGVDLDLDGDSEDITLEGPVADRDDADDDHSEDVTVEARARDVAPGADDDTGVDPGLDSGVDLDLGLGADSADETASMSADEIDFDIGGTDTAGDEDYPELAGSSDTVLDLDFGAEIRVRGNDAASGDSAADDLDFDLGGLGDAESPAGDGADDLDLDLGQGDLDETAESPLSDGDDDMLDDSVFDTVKLGADEMAAATGRSADKQGAVSSSDQEDEDAADKRRDEDANLLEDAIERLDSELDFDIGTDDGTDLGEEFNFDIDSGDGILLDGESEDTDDKTLVLGRGAGGELDEAQTKLDLAQAYIDMGDNENARAILGEVMAEGSDNQIAEAKTLLGKLS